MGGRIKGLNLLRNVKIHPDLFKTIDELREKKIFFDNITPSFGEERITEIYRGENKVEKIEEDWKYDMDIGNGLSISTSFYIAGYDETIQRFRSLEGVTVLVVYVLSYLGEKDYFPSALVALNFYTSAKGIAENSKTLKYSERTEGVINKDITDMKTDFILENVQPYTVLLIDGPLIAGDYYTTLLDRIGDLHDKDVIPVFIVKNSDSDLVIDKFPDLRHRYNSDLHWANKELKSGQRSGMFIYTAAYNSTRNKVFCYMRSCENVPIRIEFHGSTYDKYNSEINNIIDLIHYQIQLQGSFKNPQPRIIAISERYAREIAAYVNFTELTKYSYITPIFDQIRFGS